MILLTYVHFCKFFNIDELIIGLELITQRKTADQSEIMSSPNNLFEKLLVGFEMAGKAQWQHSQNICTIHTRIFAGTNHNKNQ